jgi:hypothetical protein
MTSDSNDITGNREINSPENSDALGPTGAGDSKLIEVPASTTKPNNSISSPVRKAPGPRTEAGKKKIKGNALRSAIFAKTILLPDESRAEFNALWRGLRKDFQPVGTFEETLVEKMAVNLWMQRRVFIAEVAGIEEVRRGRSFRRDDHSPTTARILVTYAGQENYSEIMAPTPAGELSERDKCTQLLKELAAGIKSSGFNPDRDTSILKKLYGSIGDDGNGLIKSYHRWRAAAIRSEEERLATGSASPGECVDCFIADLENETRRVENQKSVESDEVALQHRQQVVPDRDLSDRLMRRLVALERSFDRLLASLERRQRIRLGHPVPAQIEVHHSIRD